MSAPSSLDYGDDDTVELMLTPEQMRMLSRAANDEDLGPSPPAPPTAAPAPATTRVGRSHGWLLAGTVAVLGAIAVLVAGLGSGAHRTTVAAAEMPVATEKPLVPRQSMAPPTPAVSPTTVASQMSVPSQTHLPPPPPAAPPVAAQTSVPAAPVETSAAVAPLPSATPATDPVRIRNPFDRSEVFEFPPGTSRQEARQAVADMLLQRALERHTR
jgi:hypothetical protein